MGLFKQTGNDLNVITEIASGNTFDISFIPEEYTHPACKIALSATRMRVR